MGKDLIFVINMDKCEKTLEDFIRMAHENRGMEYDMNTNLYNIFQGNMQSICIMPASMTKISTKLMWPMLNQGMFDPNDGKHNMEISK